MQDRVTFWVLVILGFVSLVALCFALRSRRYWKQECDKLLEGTTVICELHGKLSGHFTRVKVMPNGKLAPTEEHLRVFHQYPHDFFGVGGPYFGAPGWEPIDGNKIAMLGVVYTKDTKPRTTT